MALNNIFSKDDRVAVDPMIVDKMKNMILFFIEECPRDLLGKVKLMKLLYFADFNHYDEHRQSISNAEYYKLQYGPVPKQVFRLLEEMADAGEIETGEDVVGNYRRTSFRSLKEFDPSIFTQQELESLTRVAEQWRHASKLEIENASHADPPWIAATMNGPIPYDLVFYRNTYGAMELDDDEIWDGDE